jgi:hypothetical protein
MVPSLSDLRMTHDPASRGYLAMYREHQVNHCPGCGRTHWYVGRVSAECGFCATVLALDASLSKNCSRPAVWRRGNGGGRVS